MVCKSHEQLLALGFWLTLACDTRTLNSVCPATGRPCLLEFARSLVGPWWQNEVKLTLTPSARAVYLLIAPDKQRTTLAQLARNISCIRCTALERTSAEPNAAIKPSNQKTSMEVMIAVVFHSAARQHLLALASRHQFGYLKEHNQLDLTAVSSFTCCLVQLAVVTSSVDLLQPCRTIYESSQHGSGSLRAPQPLYSFSCQNHVL